MKNTAWIRRSSEFVATLIIIISTVVFISVNPLPSEINPDRISAVDFEVWHETGPIETEGPTPVEQGENADTFDISQYTYPAEDMYLGEDKIPIVEDIFPKEESEPAEETKAATPPVLASRAMEPVYMYVQVDWLNLRSGPGSDTERLGVLPLGTRVQVLDVDGEWTKVLTPEEEEVFVYTEYIDAARPPVYNYVNVNLINVRQGPGSDTDKLTTLARGSRVQVLEQQGEWLKILTKDNREAYVYAPYMVASETLVSRGTTSQPYNSGTASSIIEYARQFAGVPYVYGGKSPKGFDCSGLTQYVYGKFKISLPRSAAEYSNVGTKVSRTDLKPGDILLFDRYNNYRLGHVGIYLGSDQFIHASSSLGKVVIMSFSKYNGNYLGARRVIK